jgi:hypothetical protein
MSLIEENQEEIIEGREALMVAGIEKERVTQTFAHARGHPNNAERPDPKS